MACCRWLARTGVPMVVVALLAACADRPQESGEAADLRSPLADRRSAPPAVDGTGAGVSANEVGYEEAPTNDARTLEDGVGTRKHALLVGVGDYIHGNMDLDGPPYDVRSLEEVLRRDWAFDRITSLVDHDATRGAILGALDDLIRDTRPGDHVFIFFSGHGTGSQEGSDVGEAPSPLAASLDPGTGGLLPADIDMRSPDAGDVLLVGRRDLRPRLQQLDRDRNVLVVFDACYSGNTVYRSWTGPGQPSSKYQPWPTTAAPAFGSATRLADDRYPYDNVIYLSASAENEAARDINREALATHPTIDGRPHGALTDALLRGLEGAGDTDGNGELTVGELHGYVRRQVETRFQHTPQLLYPPGLNGASDRPVFNAVRVSEQPASPVSTPPSSPALRVYLGPGAAGLRGQVAGAYGVLVVTGGYDLHVDASGRGAFTVRHGSGDLLGSGLDAEETVRRVEWQALVHELLGESFPGQDFNVVLDILDVEVRDGRRQVTARTNAELFVGGTYEMTYGADVPAYFLMVTVDVHGAMRLLVPWTEQDLDAAREGRIPDLNIFPPTGTEFVKLFAFRERPAGLDTWLPERGANGQPRVRSIESRGDLESLLRFVREHAEVAAETTRKFPTAIR